MSNMAFRRGGPARLHRSSSFSAAVWNRARLAPSGTGQLLAQRYGLSLSSDSEDDSPAKPKRAPVAQKTSPKDKSSKNFSRSKTESQLFSSHFRKLRLEQEAGNEEETTNEASQERGSSPQGHLAIDVYETGETASLPSPNVNVKQRLHFSPRQAQMADLGQDENSDREEMDEERLPRNKGESDSTKSIRPSISSSGPQMLVEEEKHREDDEVPKIETARRVASVSIRELSRGETEVPRNLAESLTKEIPKTSVDKKKLQSATAVMGTENGRKLEMRNEQEGVADPAISASSNVATQSEEDVKLTEKQESEHQPKRSDSEASVDSDSSDDYDLDAWSVDPQRTTINREQSRETIPRAFLGTTRLSEEERTSQPPPSIDSKLSRQAYSAAVDRDHVGRRHPLLAGSGKKISTNNSSRSHTANPHVQPYSRVDVSSSSRKQDNPKGFTSVFSILSAMEVERENKLRVIEGARDRMKRELERRIERVREDIATVVQVIEERGNLMMEELTQRASKYEKRNAFPNVLLLHEQDNLSAQIDDISALSSMAEAAKTSRRKSAGFRSVPLSNTKAAESHGHIIAPCNEEEYAALKFIETVRGSNLGQELERSVLNGRAEDPAEISAGLRDEDSFLSTYLDNLGELEVVPDQLALRHLLEAPLSLVAVQTPAVPALLKEECTVFDDGAFFVEWKYEKSESAVHSQDDSDVPCSVLFEIGLFEEEQEKPTALLGTTEQSVYEGSVRHTIEHPERHVVRVRAITGGGESHWSASLWLRFRETRKQPFLFALGGFNLASSMFQPEAILSGPSLAWKTFDGAKCGVSRSPREFSRAVSLQSTIYIVGGEGRDGREVDILRPFEEEMWSIGPDLLEGRRGHSIAADNNKGLVLAVGGASVPPSLSVSSSSSFTGSASPSRAPSPLRRPTSSQATPGRTPLRPSPLRRSPTATRWRLRDGPLSRQLSETLSTSRAAFAGPIGSVTRTSFSPLRTCEYFAPDGRRGWQLLPSLSKGRYLHSSAVLHSSMFVFGGCSEEGKALKGGVRLDMREKRWQVFGRRGMEYARYGSSAVAIRGSIVVTAGYDERDNVLSSVEIYDPRADRWRSGGDLSLPRGDHATVGLGGGVVVCGGRSYVKDGCREGSHDKTRLEWTKTCEFLSFSQEERPQEEPPLLSELFPSLCHDYRYHHFDVVAVAPLSRNEKLH